METGSRLSVTCRYRLLTAWLTDNKRFRSNKLWLSKRDEAVLFSKDEGESERENRTGRETIWLYLATTAGSDAIDPISPSSLNRKRV